ncbi:hypothetical protein LUZ60_013746 [Juncus effusus]|nr:hypothetical protein LUZ60_013746 [Juncus effusus]
MDLLSNSSSSNESIKTLEPSSSNNNNITPTNHKNKSTQTEPEVGMIFNSEEQAYSFYNNYAQKKGFSVRKGHLGRRRNGSICNRVFLCSKEGTRQKHSKHFTKKPRNEVRTNCMARIEYKVDFEGIFRVSKVIYEHNHLLVRPSKSHLLRSHRRAFSSEEKEGEGNETLDFPLEEERESEEIGFLLREKETHLHTDRMKELEKGDVQFLLEFLKCKKLEDPSFYYAVQLDDDEKVTNVFWTDSKSILDYSYFGDVVLFDTSYRFNNCNNNNKNELSMVTFLGINYHKQVVMFGTALLLDETTETFVWLFNTFLEGICAKKPKTIFTDNWAPIERAVGLIFPETNHRLCLWHIIQNASVNIPNLYSSEPEFRIEFKNYIFEKFGTEADFHQGWVDLNNRYRNVLGTNLWIQELYSVREKWGLIYQNGIFCASMTTLNWYDNLKGFFRKYFNRKLPLLKFLGQLQKSLIKLREKELYEDHKSRQTKPVLLVETPMLIQASNSYTRTIYNEFEEEFKNQLLCLCEPISINGPSYLFRVSLPGKTLFGIVQLNPSNLEINCSCKKFETNGILCMHALKVLGQNNVLHLPSQYILKRWIKYANLEVLNENFRHNYENAPHDPLREQYERVCKKAVFISLKSVFSEDALQIFENEIDKLNGQVENCLREGNGERNGEEELGGNGEGVKRKRGRKSKGLIENKKSNKGVVQNNPSLSVGIQRSEIQLNTGENAGAERVIIDESSSQIYCDINMEPSEMPFPQETILPPQEQFMGPQAMYDHQSNNPNLISWCNLRGGIAIPNFVNWVVPTNNISMPMATNTLNAPMNSAVPNQHHSLTRKLSFDINEGN